MKTLLDTRKLHVFVDDADNVIVDTRTGRSITMTLQEFILASNTLAQSMEESDRVTIETAMTTAEFILASNTPTIEIDGATAETLRALSEADSMINEE